MRVCILQPYLDAFKGGNHLPLLESVSGVEFHILTSKMTPVDGHVPDNVTVEEIGRIRGPYYYGIRDTWFATKVLHMYPPSHAFWKQFDVIHLNQTMGPALTRLKQSGVPVLYTIHHPVTADKMVCVEESTFKEGLQWMCRYNPLIVQQKKTVRNSTHTMVVSNTVMQRVAGDYGVEPHEMTVVPNGVDGHDFTLSQEKPRFDAIAVGSLLHPRKGFEYLVDVYKELSGHGLKVADVGKRSLAQRTQLEQIQGVTIFGTVEHAELVDLIRSSACLLSASLYEGFGLSLIEALSCGRPAFAFGAGAVPEVLNAIDPSLIVSPRDTAALTNKVLEFLALPKEKRDEIGLGYRESVLSLYPLSASGEGLYALYESLANS